MPTFLKEVGGAPLWLVQSLAMTGLAGIYRLLQWTAVGLLLALLVRNPFTLRLYASMLFFSFTARAKGVLVSVFALAASDWQRLFRGKGANRPPDGDMLTLQVFGLFLGCVLSAVLPPKALWTHCVGVAAAAGAPLPADEGRSPIPMAASKPMRQGRISAI